MWHYLIGLPVSKDTLSLCLAKLKPEAFRIAEVIGKMDQIRFYLKPVFMVFSGVCSRIKWEEKNKSKNKTLDGHYTERHAN